jgi:alkylation response protein AidB-like acyl-CoA dehydrogenase
VQLLRDFCEKEIAPYAAHVDEKARYTNEALAALNSSGFSAIHIPEEYGGQGGDSIATCIVIEEVARVCASSSLIPICNIAPDTTPIFRSSGSWATPRSPRSMRAPTRFSASSCREHCRSSA